MKRVCFVFAVSAAALFAFSTAPTQAHPGNVGKDGCHVQRSTGQRHCHPERQKSGGATARKAPAADRKADGQTTPKQP